MLTNAFVRKTKAPTQTELDTALGPAKPLWQQLLTSLAGEIGGPVYEWSSYSVTAGWSLKVRRRTRTILYMSPFHGSFRVSFALGDKAVTAALRSDLPPRAIKIIKGAKRYAEGTAVRMEVKGAADIAIICTIAKCKLEN